MPLKNPRHLFNPPRQNYKIMIKTTKRCSTLLIVYYSTKFNWMKPIFTFAKQIRPNYALNLSTIKDVDSNTNMVIAVHSHIQS